MIKQKYINGVPQVRPWVRFWARMIDLNLFHFTIIVLVPYTVLSVLDNVTTANPFKFFILFAWIFLESIFLTCCGTTPGKWLLQITVRDQQNNKPDFIESFRRSCLVLIYGQGIGIPIIGFIAQIIAYFKLKNNGITSWDKDGKIQIKHKKISMFRVIIASVFLVITFSLTFATRVIPQETLDSWNQTIENR